MESSNNVYKENSKKTFDNQAKIYDETYNGKHASALYKVVIEKVHQFNPESLLDVGCGNGKILSMLDKNGDSTLCGIDLSQEMINEAKKKLNSKVKLIVGDSEHLPWGEETFDCITCNDSFHHYPQAENVLKQMARVLKKRGEIIIGDPWAPIFLRQLTNLFCKFSKEGDFRIYSKMEIINLLKKCGFKNIVWEKVNCKSFIVTAEVDK
ncbi:class I SAM-dependent methyltransferase [Clostridium sp.]|uniref:class I SAM-dependent methyltransferase n=1 Tax=Clostridium sp. TaxID=1506 RepID=UPI00261438CB|nr:class I SAM-dependent methyltransferase [Clostridium sp.]